MSQAARLRELLKKNPETSAQDVRRLLGLTSNQARQALYKARKQTGVILGEVIPFPAGSTRPTSAAKTPESIPSVGFRVFPDSAELVTENPCTLEDLIRACKVDLSRWKVARWVANKWEVGAKTSSGTIARTPLFQIKAWLEPVENLKDADALRDAIEWIRQNPPVPAVPKTSASRKLEIEDPHLLEIAIPDLHHGKLTWAKETGEDYDLKISAALHQEAVENLWYRSAAFPIEKILLVVGHDFFNVNNAKGETANGTPQQEDGRWQKSWRTGIQIIRDGIEFLRGKAPGGVEVRFIRGNHDSERLFMAGDVVAAMYANAGDVEIINEPSKRQYMQWGTVLLGFAHGDRIKHDKLPLLMAGEAPQLWAATTHREWHLGHLHHKRETQFHAGIEHGPVRVRILPSLTTADDFHYTNGYVGALRAAESYLWSKRRGYVGHLSWSPVLTEPK